MHNLYNNHFFLHFMTLFPCFHGRHFDKEFLLNILGFAFSQHIICESNTF